MYSESRTVNTRYFMKRIIKAALGRDHLFLSEIQIEKVRLGTSYGGWFIAPKALPQDRPALVLSFGIGDDISFDLEMIKRYGAVVHAFDPTPKSIAWLASQKDLPDGFVAHPIGVASYDGVQHFSMPTRSDWDNYSVRRDSSEVVECQVRRIDTIISDIGVNQVDIIKLDVEGSEYSVLDEFLKGSHMPAQLLVEFHHGMDGIRLQETTSAVTAIKKRGYRIFDVSPWGREFSFVHESVLRAS